MHWRLFQNPMTIRFIGLIYSKPIEFILIFPKKHWGIGIILQRMKDFAIGDKGVGLVVSHGVIRLLGNTIKKYLNQFNFTKIIFLYFIWGNNGLLVRLDL